MSLWDPGLPPGRRILPPKTPWSLGSPSGLRSFPLISFWPLAPSLAHECFLPQASGSISMLLSQERFLRTSGLCALALYLELLGFLAAFPVDLN